LGYDEKRGYKIEVRMNNPKEPKSEIAKKYFTIIEKKLNC
jgi:hypothetical protein